MYVCICMYVQYVCIRLPLPTESFRMRLPDEMNWTGPLALDMVAVERKGREGWRGEAAGGHEDEKKKRWKKMVCESSQALRFRSPPRPDLLPFFPSARTSLPRAATVPPTSRHARRVCAQVDLTKKVRQAGETGSSKIHTHTHKAGRLRRRALPKARAARRARHAPASGHPLSRSLTPPPGAASRPAPPARPAFPGPPSCRGPPPRPSFEGRAGEFGHARAPRSGGRP